MLASLSIQKSGKRISTKGTNKFMKKNIVNVNDLDWESDEHGDFAHHDKQLSAAVGGKMLGTSLYKVMPGKKTFPYHFHYANEEAVFVLEGSGTLRMSNEMIPIKQGDYIVFPVGPEYAHQIINTSDTPLVFLCFSTMNHPDVVEYPDSNKIGVTAGVAPGGDPKKILLKARFRKRDQVDYFDGEK
jgi:uncharacterized cupin superfamily protein